MTYGSPTLRFTHRTARVTIVLTDYTEGLASVQLTGLSTEGDNPDIIVPYDKGSNTYTAIVAPQNVAAGTAFIVCTFTNGKTFVYKMKNATDWQAGGEYTYTVSLAAAKDLGYTIESNGSYTVTSADGLMNVAKLVNGGKTDINITLDKNIDLTGKDWTPIGTDEHPFSGKFNGGNHTISGLNVTTGTMQDLTVAGVKGKGGGLFLNVSGEGAQIANLTVTGTVNGDPSGMALAAGGITARLGPGAVIYRCLNKVAVTLGGTTSSERDSYTYAGGVAGYSEGHIIYCVNEGAVTASAETAYSMAGGIAGSQHGGSILFSDNDAEVAIPHIADGGYRMAYAGGIAGTMRSASVSCVRNQRSVSCDMSYVYAGGITAHAMDTVLRDAVNAADVRCSVQRDLTAMAGGIAAQLYSGSSAVNCYNTGGVTVTGSASYAYAGGIAGWSGALRSSNKIYNCTNSGAISAEAISSARVGGLAGELNKTELYASVSTGAVSAGRFVAGGVAGYKYPEADIHDVAYAGDFPPVAFGDRNSADAQSLTEEEISGFVVTAFPSLSPVIAAVWQGDEKNGGGQASRASGPPRRRERILRAQRGLRRACKPRRSLDRWRRAPRDRNGARRLAARRIRRHVQKRRRRHGGQVRPVALARHGARMGDCGGERRRAPERSGDSGRKGRRRHQHPLRPDRDSGLRRR